MRFPIAFPIALPIAALLLLAPLRAAADPGPAQDDCARARKAGKPCVLDVAGEDVTGDAPTATGTTVHAATFDPRISLIRVRREFLREIVKSADDL
ncbi:MAG TPA: hypothetical protein VFP84_22040 [Kofleriaceae bacterium]|nr:hypothetical protein [Kofleriaceae bacterium]